MLKFGSTGDQIDQTKIAWQQGAPQKRNPESWHVHHLHSITTLLLTGPSVTTMSARSRMMAYDQRNCSIHQKFKILMTYY